MQLLMSNYLITLFNSFTLLYQNRSQNGCRNSQNGHQHKINKKVIADLYLFMLCKKNVNVTDTISWRGHHDRVMS